MEKSNTKGDSHLRVEAKDHQLTVVIIRGGGDLASGVALRLHRSGFRIVILELAQPFAVRRTVCFSEAVYAGLVNIEGIRGRLSPFNLVELRLREKDIPVLIDPDAACMEEFESQQFVLVDARMLKQPPEPLPIQPDLYIGLGPGFQAGKNCDAVVETRRGHTLGRLYWEGGVLPDSGQPEGDSRRVLRAPIEGTFIGNKNIGDHCSEGEVIAEIQNLKGENRKVQIVTRLAGVIRGLLRTGMTVLKDMKIGDVDPRNDPAHCYLVSDKSLAVGGAVLEAILAKSGANQKKWD